MEAPRPNMEEAPWTLYTGTEDFRLQGRIRRIRVAPHVTEIGEGTFRFVFLLEEVDLGSIDRIGAHAFEGCGRLANLRLPYTVLEIGPQGIQWMRVMESGFRQRDENRT